ncbi:hypothetical protein [Sphingomonas sp. Root720]|uniref:hypothetical protein n=2 Tax=Sphingomonas TaxID=13687 RepID=UPI0006FCF712|nr:hypothetical protein [Sphingomonas sp. Root720]KQX22645.1 hypothetical protein ASD17_04940 [Sphingomonas sp. Root1294]KQY67876.1 hypothetical protein ASD39_08190 [Sphingomonas sp. Root50]KRB88800.1 hypothetical protein ASE22_20535 [Sphingomonas sp. Root720]
MQARAASLATRPGAAGSVWTRRAWMRLAAASGGCAIAIWLWTNLADPAPGMPHVRIAAQLQLVHAMTCFASATFMNLGALKARFAPPCFLSGSFCLCGSLYLPSRLHSPLTSGIALLGVALLLTGWSVLIVASGAIDRQRPE